MLVSLIVAYDRNRGIGKDNFLPWAGKIPRDMARFKEMTLGKSVIMGRKTFESIGSALPGRMNIVLTHDRNWNAPGVWHVGSLDEAFRVARQNGTSDEVVTIGGARLYREALPFVSRMYITDIDAEFDCDAHFPQFNFTDWRCTQMEVVERDAKNAYRMTFYTLERKTA